MEFYTDAIDLIDEIFQGFTAYINANHFVFAMMLISIIGVGISVFWLVFNRFSK